MKRKWAEYFEIDVRDDESIEELERRISQNPKYETEIGKGLIHGDIIGEYEYPAWIQPRIVCGEGKGRKLIKLKPGEDNAQEFAIPLVVTKSIDNPTTYFREITSVLDGIDGFELDKHAKIIKKMFKQPSEVLEKAKFYLARHSGLVIQWKGIKKIYKLTAKQEVIERDFAATKQFQLYAELIVKDSKHTLFTIPFVFSKLDLDAVLPKKWSIKERNSKFVTIEGPPESMADLEKTLRKA